MRMAVIIAATDRPQVQEFDPVLEGDQNEEVPDGRIPSAGSYPKLSQFMGTYPADAIFRRFDALNVENLLYLQAELSHLERELQTVRGEPVNGRPPLSSQSWFDLSSEMGPEHPSWTVLKDIRSKLHEYSESPHENCLFPETITEAPYRCCFLAI
jgi:hypothetical protein